MPAIYSHAHRGFLHLGKLPAQPIRDAIPFADAKAAFLKAGGTLPPVPKMFGHSGDFANGPTADGGWGMLGNGPCDDGSINPDWAAYQGAGDCAWAGPAHEEMEAAKNAGRPVPKFTCLNVLQQYSAYSGYDLETGANDNGSAVADVIAWRQDKGLEDADGNVYKIGQSFNLTPGDMQQLWEAAYLLECVGIGINVQQAQMDQFQAGKPWAYVAGSPVEGGHYIPIVGKLRLITWATKQEYAESLYEKLCDEAVGYLDLERYNAVTGEDAEHYTSQDIEKYFAVLAASTN